MMNRRQFLFSGGALSVCAGAYPCYWEPRWFELTEKRVSFRGRSLPASVRLLHISDLHASVLFPVAMIDRAVSLSLSVKPDLICITGDFVSRGYGYDADAYISILRQLSQSGVWLGRRSGFGRRPWHE